MIFKLPQWAGYRDRASFGIADSYLRLGDLEKALKWFNNLKEVFPKFYESQKVADLEKLVESRLARVRAGGAKAEHTLFAGFGTGFEPDEKEWFGDVHNLAVVRGPGLQGPHALLLDSWPRELVAYEYARPLKDLTPGGTYWAEVWYRDLFWPPPPHLHGPPNLQVRLVSETPIKAEVLATATLQRNSRHHWHKLSFKLKAPLAQDFTLKISLLNFTGAFLVDALTIRPVSDRHLDSLLNFLEGTKGP